MVLSFQQSFGDVFAEEDQLVAFGKLATESEGKPEDNSAAPFDAFFPEALKVFFLRDLLGTIALADTDAMGESLEVVVGEFLFGDDVVEDSAGEVVEFHFLSSHFVEEVFFFGTDEIVAFPPEVIRWPGFAIQTH